MDGLQRLLDFLDMLRKRKIQFVLSQQQDDGVMVSFALVGQRVEVEFFVHGMEFSYFSGHEDVFVDESELKKLIDEHWD